MAAERLAPVACEHVALEAPRIGARFAAFRLPQAAEVRSIERFEQGDRVRARRRGGALDAMRSASRSSTSLIMSSTSARISSRSCAQHGCRPPRGAATQRFAYWTVPSAPVLGQGMASPLAAGSARVFRRLNERGAWDAEALDPKFK